MQGPLSLLRLIWYTFNEWWMNHSGLVAAGLCPEFRWLLSLWQLSKYFPHHGLSQWWSSDPHISIFSWHLGVFLSSLSLLNFFASTLLFPLKCWGKQRRLRVKSSDCCLGWGFVPVPFFVAYLGGSGLTRLVDYTLLLSVIPFSHWDVCSVLLKFASFLSIST